MGFVARELIEKDKKWLEQFGLGNPFSSRFGPNYDNIIIENKEDEAVLVCLGGQGYMKIEDDFYSDFPLIFYFIWNGYLLYIECHYETYEMTVNPITRGVKYKIEMIRNESDCYPERDIKIMKESIKELLKEALSLYQGWYECPHKKIEFLKIADPICL